MDAVFVLADGSESPAQTIALLDEQGRPAPSDRVPGPGGRYSVFVAPDDRGPLAGGPRPAAVLLRFTRSRSTSYSLARLDG